MDSALYLLDSGAETGVMNMALDEALLDWVRVQPEPVLVVRTYEWAVPTLSLGIHQPERDVPTLMRRYGDPSLVCRPTGGRAILHGEDVSFSFITNRADICRLSLEDSYARLTAVVRDALESCGVAVASSGEKRQRAYTRSAVCFETQTPSDLLGPDGRKLAGSAQLRRQGGILQHGAAFLKTVNLAPQAFTQGLFDSATRSFALPAQNFDEGWLGGLLERKRQAFCSSAAGILARVSTTAGSHLTPASL